MNKFSETLKSLAQLLPALVLVNFILGAVLFFNLDYSLVAVVEDEELKPIVEGMFEHFSKLLAALLFILTLLVSVLGLGIYTSLRTRIEQHIGVSVRGKMAAEIASVQTIIYNNHAFQWWQSFEPLLQEFLGAPESFEKSKSVQCLRFVRTANGLAEHGFGAFDDLPASEKDGFLADVKSQEALVSVLNLKVYCYAADLLLRNDRPTGYEIREMEKRCEYMLELALGSQLRRANYGWWDAAETACFFYLGLGKKYSRRDLVAKGTSIYIELVEGRSLKWNLAPVPTDVSERIRFEYEVNQLAPEFNASARQL